MILIDRNILARNETFFVSLTKPLMYRIFKKKKKTKINHKYA